MRACECFDANNYWHRSAIGAAAPDDEKIICARRVLRRMRSDSSVEPLKVRANAEWPNEMRAHHARLQSSVNYHRNALAEVRLI